ncbi:MAG: glycosyltransferase [Chitinophagaceae bacterium]|jgi:teichuronic acid biosynthesis glycosyltransferase TuaG|nr:glycosyltransferase [Chitinophagaceae bacterium]
MNGDLVSIIVPVYNSASTLDKTIKSIVDQSHSNWEMLLYLDAPTDQSVSIAKAWAIRDDRIRLINADKNRGVVVARNICIRLAKGRFVAFCDADDWWGPNKLKGQLDLLINNKANFCYGSAIYVASEGNWYSRPARMPDHLDLERLYQGNPIGMSTVVMDVVALGKQYFQKLPAPFVHEDYEYWLRLFKIAPISAVYDARPDTFVTIHLDTRSGNKWLAIRSQYYILKHVHGLSRCKVLFYMFSYLFWAFYKRGMDTWLVQLGWAKKDKNNLP